MVSKNIGQRINKALTCEQTDKLLTAFFSSLSGEQIAELLASLSSDTAETISKLIAPENRKSGSRQANSTAKNIEIWNDLWEKWHEIVADVGEEEGRYAYQENHWEPPCFDGSALADDLDKIAEKMLPLLDTIHETGYTDPDIFAAAIDEIEDQVKLYPEWMSDFDHEEIYVKKNVTRCVLQWEKLHSESTTEFVKRLATLQNEWHCQLDNNAFIDFCDCLPDVEKREVYDHITENSQETFWQKTLDSTWSAWHHVYHSLSQLLDQGAYLENCARLLQKNWRYGLPVIDELMQKGEDAKAEETISQTVGSYINSYGKRKWAIESTLLINALAYGYGEPEETLCEVLEKWLSISERGRRDEKVAALKFQLAAYRNPYDWEEIATVYHEISQQSSTDLAEKLFNQWKFYVVTDTFGLNFGDQDNSQDCWLRWLVDLGTDKKKNGAWFSKQVEKWLGKIRKTRLSLSRFQQKAFFLLTKDVLELSGDKENFVNLYKIVGQWGYSGRPADNARQLLLKKMQISEFIPSLLATWCEVIERFMPDPAKNHKSRYDEHARWLAAAYELDKKGYQRVVNRWKSDHQRRRNLWKALQEHDLPM